MYRNPRAPGPIHATKLSAAFVTSNGEETEIKTFSPPLFFNLFQKGKDRLANVGVGRYVLFDRYLRPMQKGDASAARQLADLIDHGRQGTLVALRLISETYRISDTGIVREGKKVATYPVSD